MTNKMILGIDPGANGAIVAIGRAGYEVNAMPATDGDVVALIKRYTQMAEQASPMPQKIAFLENIVMHMGEGIPASTMAVYASNWGVLKGALMMAGWRLELVRPQDWQKVLGLGITGRQRATIVAGMSSAQIAAEKSRIKLLNGQLIRDWKNKLKATAQRLFPGTTVTLGNADALLIAEYGQRISTHPAGATGATNPMKEK